MAVSDSRSSDVPGQRAFVDAGLNTPLLEVVGATEEDNMETVRFFGDEVLRHLKPASTALANAT